MKEALIRKAHQVNSQAKCWEPITGPVSPMEDNSMSAVTTIIEAVGKGICEALSTNFKKGDVMKDISAIGIDKLAQWCYDTDFDQFVKDMGFEDFTEDYNHEKFRYMQTRLAMWLGTVSEQYLKNLAEAINNKGSRYEKDN